MAASISIFWGTPLLGLLLLSSGAHAQASDGWRALGEMLGGRKAQDQRAYQEGYREGVELEAAKWEAIRARQQADDAELQLSIILALEKAWRSFGLGAEEARAVALTFEFTTDQVALNARALRDGSTATREAAIAAYRDYRYLLANQLLLAAANVPAASPPD